MFGFLKKWRNAKLVRPLTMFAKLVWLTTAKVEEWSDDEIQGKRAEYNTLVASGADVNDLLPEMFAVVYVAVVRKLKITPYESQLMAGLVLFNGSIAEMGTGEGKTLAAVFAAYARAAMGMAVHVSTANSYLAGRDATAMKPVYEALGLSVGALNAEQVGELKQRVYACDVVYGTHQDFAQDFLRDNLVQHPALRMQHALDFVIVDEADATLIDDARTPVIITASSDAKHEDYRIALNVARALVRTGGEDDKGDFYIDQSIKRAVLTERGYGMAAMHFANAGLLPESNPDALFQEENHHLLHKLGYALSALYIYHRDQHYVIKDGEMVLVDALTGRLLPGRKWDSGLQQALEMVEGLPLSPETHLLAATSLQSYYRQYGVLAGMTGTAETDAEEFLTVYALEVVTIPPNKPVIRQDLPDRLFRNQEKKLDALVEDIFQRHTLGQPVLIGTTSIAQSEALSARLTSLGLPHEVLNAKEHMREADIIAAAGRPKAITVSTNMAGRGVDIVLGGNFNTLLMAKLEELGAEAWNALDGAAQKAIYEAVGAEHEAIAAQVKAAGGLHVIGMERYESRRQDRQLQGRAGRQGDPGSSQFFLAKDDPLIENYAGDTIRNTLAALDVKEGDSLEYNMVKAMVDGAQRQAEAASAMARKQMLKYDDVLTSQRNAIYGQRNHMLEGNELPNMVDALTLDFATNLVDQCLPRDEMPENWEVERMVAELTELGIQLDLSGASTSNGVIHAIRRTDPDEVVKAVYQAIKAKQQVLLNSVPESQQVSALMFVAINALDRNWMLHLEELENMRKGIYLRGFANQDPLQAYKRDAYRMFEEMLDNIRKDVVKDTLIWQLTE